MQHVFIIGAKGLSFYGGYEQFLYKLLQYQKDKKEIEKPVPELEMEVSDERQRKSKKTGP